MSIFRRIIWGIRKRIRLFFHPYDQIFKDTNSKCHFIGIGGIGMSAIAHIMKDRGFRITGSDIKESNITKKLENAGVKVFIGHDKKNLAFDTDVVIVSSAISRNNPEIGKALDLGIPIVKRSFVLGQLMKERKGIAVSGTHGKTTTTTMISLILQKAGLDPIALIGGEVRNIGGNYLIGKGEYMVVEACEYDRSFLDLAPYIAVITNIEPDHLDYYRDIEEIKSAFLRFVTRLPREGLLVISADDSDTVDVSRAAQCKVIGYGFGSKNRMSEGVLNEYWEIEDVTQKNSGTLFTISDGKNLEHFTLQIPGKHNVSNACAAIIVANHLGINTNIIREFLDNFKGTNRRFQIKGEKKGIIVVDDYAHHPTEIKATLEGVKKFYEDRKIIVIFEPHQYSRTYFLLEEFGKSFNNADLVIIPDIYAVRDSEKDKHMIDASRLVEEIKNNDVNALYISGYGNIVKYLQENVRDNSVIITIGAGNVYKIGEEFLK